MSEAASVGELNLVNSSSAAITYARRGIVAWRVAIPFAAAIIVFAPVGAWLNVQLPAKPLLIFFALFTASAAILMLSGWKPRRAEMSSRGRVTLGLTAGRGSRISRRPSGSRPLAPLASPSVLPVCQGVRHLT